MSGDAKTPNLSNTKSPGIAGVSFVGAGKEGLGPQMKTPGYAGGSFCPRQKLFILKINPLFFYHKRPMQYLG